MRPLATMETQTKGKAGYRGRIVNNERPREERSAILVDHSTDSLEYWTGKVGKCCSSDPLKGR